jgi:hypothetical protein
VRCSGRAEPPTAGGDQEQNDWYYNHQAASNFPAELLYLPSILRLRQRQFLIAKYSDPNISSRDMAGVNRFYSIS